MKLMIFTVHKGGNLELAEKRRDINKIKNILLPPHILLPPQYFTPPAQYFIPPAQYFSVLQMIRDNESNTWQIISGSFDRSVKIWTQDIQLIHKIEG